MKVTKKVKSKFGYHYEDKKSLVQGQSLFMVGSPYKWLINRKNQRQNGVNIEITLKDENI